MNDQIEIATAASAASSATKATYGSAAIGAGSWFLSSGIGLLISAIGVFGGLWLTWYWRRKEYELKKLADDRAHQLQLLAHEAKVALGGYGSGKDAS